MTFLIASALALSCAEPDREPTHLATGSVMRSIPIEADADPLGWQVRFQATVRLDTVTQGRLYPGHEVTILSAQKLQPGQAVELSGFGSTFTDAPCSWSTFLPVGRAEMAQLADVQALPVAEELMTLHLKTARPGRVEIDGTSQPTPATVELPVGVHRIVFHEGAQNMHVAIAAGEDRTICMDVVRHRPCD
jgi:hypothetical protein